MQYSEIGFAYKIKMGLEKRSFSGMQFLMAGAYTLFHKKNCCRCIGVQNETNSFWNLIVSMMLFLTPYCRY